jgi:ABC-type bacteriocin/lantibiotic exporter with double-glycine peptidase domain
MSEEIIATQLVKVLAANGISMTVRGIVELCGSLDVSGILRGLRRAGVDARLIRLRAGDVSFLPPSSLVWTDESVPSILMRASPGAARLELPSGEIRRMTKAEMDALRVRAIAVRKHVTGEGTLVGRLLTAFRRDPRSLRAIGLVLAMSVASLAFGLAMPLASRLALQQAVLERAPAKVVAAALAVVLLSVHAAWAGWIRRRALIFAELTMEDLGTEEVLRHLLGLPFARLDRLEVGHALELTRLAPVVSNALITIGTSAVDGVIALGYLGFVYWIDPWSGLAATVGAVILTSLGIVFGRHARERRQASLDARRKHQQGLYEMVAGIETIRAEAAEERMLVRHLSRLVTVQGLALKEQQEVSLHSLLTLLVDRLVYGSILVFVASRVLAGTAGLGDLLAAVQASASFFASAQALARLPDVIFSLKAHAKRVDDVLAEPSESLDGAVQTNAAPEQEDALVLRNVWFRYDPSAPWVLKGLDVTVPRGSTVVLEWPSGAGKSTLLRLLSGLLTPERGDVLVFGTEASRARHLTAYLPQHAALLPMSLMDNLRLLSGGAPTERIVAAAQATGLAALVKSWPMGFDTVVSAGGSNVSSGQRQLVLFTAAIASPAPILLLDEAFAHMDGMMRASLATLDILRGRTVIAVVHDATTGEKARATATLVLGRGEGAKLLAQ